MGENILKNNSEIFFLTILKAELISYFTGAILATNDGEDLC